MARAAQQTEQSENGTNSAENNVILLDLGSKSRKNVKRLRKGRGKLMRRVMDTITDLKAEEEIAENAQVVVVVVKQRPRKNDWLRW